MMQKNGSIIQKKSTSFASRKIYPRKVYNTLLLSRLECLLLRRFVVAIFRTFNHNIIMITVRSPTLLFPSTIQPSLFNYFTRRLGIITPDTPSREFIRHFYDSPGIPIISLFFFSFYLVSVF